MSRFNIFYPNQNTTPSDINDIQKEIKEYSIILSLLDPNDPERFNQILNELERRLYEVFGVIPATATEKEEDEISKIPEEIRVALESDYKNQQEVFEFYEVLKPGETSYVSDYAETAGQKYEMPTLEDIFSWLTEEQVKQYKAMEKKGFRPRLQLTPIGYNIRTLASKIDAHKTMDDQDDIEPWKEVIDSEIKYAPTDYDVTDPDKLVTQGGMSKEEYIKENKGWLVDIVATKQNLDSIISPEIERLLTNAEKVKIYHTVITQKNLKGLTYEIYLIAQMRALKEGKPLDSIGWTILPESSINKANMVSSSSWYLGEVRVVWEPINTYGRLGGCRCRFSMRIKKT